MSSQESYAFHQRAMFGEYEVEAAEYRDYWLFTVHFFTQPYYQPRSARVQKNHPLVILSVGQEALDEEQKESVMMALRKWTGLTKWGEV